MLKSYCPEGQDQFYINPEEQLNQALQKYEKGLQYLEDFRNVDSVNISLNKINAIWSKDQQIILHTPTRDALPELLDLNEQLLGLSHQIVLDVQAKSGKTLGTVIKLNT